MAAWPLSALVTEINARPDIGSFRPAPSIALPYASPKVEPTPITSPVECISGPRIGSTPANFLNGKTGDFTKTSGTGRTFGNPKSASVLWPAITSDAILAIGTPVAFATNGTV